MSPRHRRPYGAAGVAVVVLALALGVGWLLGLVLALFPTTASATGEQIQLLNGIGQVLAGAIAAYLGSNIRTQGRQDAADDTADAAAAGRHTTEGIDE